MDDQRVGRILRSLRRRRGWRQSDVAKVAGCSQNLVSLLERGHLDRVSVRQLRRVFMSLDAAAVIELRWRGAAIDRLLDEDHASLLAEVVQWLRRLGWLTEVEVTYAEFSERGSIDILAFHPGSGILLVIEIKTELASAEATLRKLDEKVRLATKVARDRFGWEARSVSRLLAISATATARRRVQRHGSLFERALPMRNVAVKRWLAVPDGRISGLWFVAPRDAQVGISARGGRDRVRVRESGPGTPLVAK